MWTKKNNFFVMSIIVNKVKIPIALFPIRCASEVVEGVLDILYVFRFISQSEIICGELIQNFLMEIKNYGKFDLVDIDVVNKSDKVKIKLLLR
jgi:hypothetical protein